MEIELNHILNNINKDILLYKGENLIDNGIIDSFEVLNIVTSLEENFEIKINAEEVVISNFSTVDNIKNFIKKKLREKDLEDV